MYCSIVERGQKIRPCDEGRFNRAADVSFRLHAYSLCMADIRVLIVDDVDRVRQDLRTFLTLTGDISIVGEARNGCEAIQLAEALCPDVVLMDLEMPVMDGYAAAHEIKARGLACRVIALTIHAGEAEQQQALRAGMADVIVKGAPLEMLLQAIRTRRRSERTDAEP
jgi:DNA-binding NarL/FixJ family response regulator